MLRAMAGLLSVLMVASFTLPADGQQLMNKGALVTQILA